MKHSRDTHTSRLDFTGRRLRVSGFISDFAWRWESIGEHSLASESTVLCDGAFLALPISELYEYTNMTSTITPINVFVGRLVLGFDYSSKSQGALPEDRGDPRAGQ